MASRPAIDRIPGVLARLRRSSRRSRVFGIVLFAPLASLASTSPLPAAYQAGPVQRIDLGSQDMVAAQKRKIAALTEGSRSEIVAKGDSARNRNAAIRFSDLPLEKMHGFAASQVPATAQTCLSQAVYYEAGFEPSSGKRAVAQVVLNRMRHPAYPNSVCGVVYQGANKRVCQFSFTCDGSLRRRPAPAAWAEAQAVARAALAGYVEESVGSATHYHADYVVPRWAYGLGKVTQLGAHIFYRFNGGLGSSRAFTAHYSGREFIPSLRSASVGNVDEGVAFTGTYSNGLTVPPDVTDRHAPADIGGRLDTSTGWRLELPKSNHYGKALDQTASPAAQASANGKPASDKVAAVSQPARPAP